MHSRLRLGWLPLVAVCFIGRLGHLDIYLQISQRRMSQCIVTHGHSARSVSRGRASRRGQWYGPKPPGSRRCHRRCARFDLANRVFPPWNAPHQPSYVENWSIAPGPTRPCPCQNMLLQHAVRLACSM
ncbi:uncharacterized protein BDZ83DRAFT_631159 [Colletotrichum acutatum]|uniref:Uncharacterized protein n=1 Tax=Glomerella acutata TaxID=27357 RepID=A0AAD8UHB3_GLOAC|nr:uncharacterized protein BDZ83DRAFT_631159 [Colletotrichum acutatum]KAK1720229.1 hypothetical protein BDZ83DRAFT_631159 [Colletotrichum acutatum]